MDTITIRQAVLADLPALAILFDGYRQFYGQSSDVAGARAFLQERFEHGQSVAFIAHDDSGRALGFTQLTRRFRPSPCVASWCSTICSSPLTHAGKAWAGNCW